MTTEKRTVRLQIRLVSPKKSDESPWQRSQGGDPTIEVNGVSYPLRARNTQGAFSRSILRSSIKAYGLTPPRGVQYGDEWTEVRKDMEVWVLWIPNTPTGVGGIDPKKPGEKLGPTETEVCYPFPTWPEEYVPAALPGPQKTS